MTISACRAHEMENLRPSVCCIHYIWICCTDFYHFWKTKPRFQTFPLFSFCYTWKKCPNVTLPTNRSRNFSNFWISYQNPHKNTFGDFRNFETLNFLFYFFFVFISMEPMGVNISNHYSYKSQLNVFKSLLNFLLKILIKNTFGIFEILTDFFIFFLFRYHGTQLKWKCYFSKSSRYFF